jgi:hypothetical protein
VDTDLQEKTLAKTVGERPSVGIVGLSDKQKRVVAEQCGGLARLGFVPSGRASTRYPPGVDLVVLSRFVPHRFSLAARGLPRLFCGGGVTAICGAIREFVSNWGRR